MDIELLRYYIKVAETLSFKEAAEALFTSQSTLSRKINSLEKEMGILLFNRTTRRVTLTEAGSLLLEDSKKLVAVFDNMMLKVNGMNGKQSGTVRIGYFRNETAEYVARIVEQMRKDYPAIKVDYQKAGLLSLQSELLDGSLDAILVFRSCMDDYKDQKRLTIAHEYPQLLLYDDHPLAKKEKITFRDLLTENVVIRDWKDIPPSVNENMHEYFRSHGIKIEVMDNDFNWGRQMMRIRLGECIMLDAFSTSSIGLPNKFHVVPVVSEDPRFDRDLIILEKNTNPQVIALVQTVEKMISEHAFE